MVRMFKVFLAVLVVALAPTPPASADGSFPEVVELPNGFFPEGIAIGTGHTFFVGSLVDGAIYRGNLRTGDGAVLVEGQAGSLAVGMDFDPRSGYLFVAGGPSGTSRVYDSNDGSLIVDVPLGAGFVNDVIVTRDAVYLTNSFAPELYELPLKRSGQIAGTPRTIPLSGDFVFTPGQFNTNGIESVNEDTLVIVNSTVGALYTVDVETGDAGLIDTAGELINGDGLVLVGRTLYAVVGGLNQVTELQLSPSLTDATITGVITNPNFNVPTTAGRFGADLYVVNAKFGTPPTPETPYEIVKVSR